LAGIGDDPASRGWYKAAPSHNPDEIFMSADKDRGIRRQKQKRAKQRKKELSQRYKPAGGEPAAAPKQA
jgi:hypothetical protein